MTKTRIQFVQQLVDLCLNMLAEMTGMTLYTYQKEIADRIFFSLLIGDAEEITVETARQVGKSETLADVSATAMIIFPKLAVAFPDDPVIKKFRLGIMIGCFAPIDQQAETIFSRIEDRLTSEQAKLFLSSPDINESVKPSGELIKVSNGSFCRRQTAHPKSKIESKTYHLIIVDEAQDADSETVRRRIHPMTTAVGGSIIKIGTPAAHKSDYYEAIRRNCVRGRTYTKRNHFTYPWQRAAKENPFYAQAIKKEMARLGEDSDEFLMSYCCKWLLERGMFITDELIEQLGDEAMEMVPYYDDSPVVIGVDVAKTHDSTVVSVIWVDWDHPDEFGLYRHVVLAWLELHGENWESQYRQICEFVSNYWVMRICIDGQGMGGPVAERLQVLLPSIEVLSLDMDLVKQSERWKHLLQLLQRRLIRWPAGRRTKRTLVYRRFVQQLSDVEKEYKGKYLLVGTPKNQPKMHDDFIDSLALGCWATKELGQQNVVEELNYNPLLERGMSRR